MAFRFQRVWKRPFGQATARGRASRVANLTSWRPRRLPLRSPTRRRNKICAAESNLWPAAQHKSAVFRAGVGFSEPIDFVALAREVLPRTGPASVGPFSLCPIGFAGGFDIAARFSSDDPAARFTCKINLCPIEPLGRCPTLKCRLPLQTLNSRTCQFCGLERGARPFRAVARGLNLTEPLLSLASRIATTITASLHWFALRAK
jgi:hypothetical protein